MYKTFKQYLCLRKNVQNDKYDKTCLINSYNTNNNSKVFRVVFCETYCFVTLHTCRLSVFICALSLLIHVLLKNLFPLNYFNFLRAIFCSSNIAYI